MSGRRVALVGCIAALVAAGLLACGLDVVGTYDTTRSGTGDAGGDARARDGEASDAGSELPLLDASSSPDAATALDGGPSPTFCAQQKPGFVYCNDFEKGVVDFPNQRTTGGSIKLDDETTNSVVNHALRVQLEDDNVSRSVYVSTPLTPLSDMTENGYDITYAFSVRSSSLLYAVIGGPFLAVDTGVTGGYPIGAASYDKGTKLDYAQSDSDLNPVAVYWLPGPTWHTAWLRYGKGPGGKPFVQTVIDNVVVGLDRPDQPSFPKLDLRLGAYFTSANKGSFDVWIDDVLVRTF